MAAERSCSALLIMSARTFLARVVAVNQTDDNNNDNEQLKWDFNGQGRSGNVRRSMARTTDNERASFGRHPNSPSKSNSTSPSNLRQFHLVNASSGTGKVEADWQKWSNLSWQPTSVQVRNLKSVPRPALDHDESSQAEHDRNRCLLWLFRVRAQLITALGFSSPLLGRYCLI